MGDLILSERIDNSLQDFFYVMFRHKRKVAWFSLGLLLIVFMVTMFMPRTYKSEAKLLVRLGRESASMDPTATASGQVVQVTQRRESEIKSELEILKSRDLAEKVVDKIGPNVIAPKSFLSFLGWFSRSPDKELMERDRAVRKVMKNWDIAADRDSNIINISYQAHSPKVAHDVVAGIIEGYLEKHLAVNRTPGSYGFFKEQTDKTANELKNTEARLAEVKNKTGLASIEEQRRILLERAGDIQRDLEQTNADYRSSQAKIATLKTQLGQLPETVVTGNTSGIPNYAADGMRQKLYDLQLKKQELLSKYTEKNFLVQETQRQIQDAAALLKKEATSRTQVTKGLNAAHQQTKMALVMEEANCTSLKSKSDAIALAQAAVNKELQVFNENEVLVAGLQREKEIQEASYREYSKKLEQARIDTALETEKISNISVAQAATYPLKPASPQEGVTLALGFMAATFGGVGMAFLAEGMNHSFSRLEDVEKRLKGQLLCAIPRVSIDESPSDSRKSNKLLLLPKAGTQCGIMSQFDECCETLCDRLLNSGAGSKTPQVIAVTSSRAGEGVSTVASNLALAMARKKNHRVLLVETNSLDPSAHKIFGISVTPGLTDVIAEGGGQLTSVNSSRAVNLDVIQSGKGEISLSQLVDSKEFAEMLDLWKSEYSFVILDLPAIFKTNAAARLACLVDGVVLVVEAENVGYEVVQRAQARLEETKANLLGVVLNKRMVHIPEWLYSRL